MEIKDLDSTRIPNHVAVIMDGNGRWAKQKGKSRIFGHKNGVKAVRDTIECAAEMGVKYVTLYAFSTENWNRPKDEVSGLMELLIVTIGGEIKTLMENNIALKAIGDIESLPNRCRKELLHAIEKTSRNTKMTLILALSYSSKWEILNAVKKLAKKVEKGELSVENIDEAAFEKQLCTKDFPDQR
jgi:undecaprenyl diphosphate synthase